MKLSPEETYMASGKAGPAKEFAMKILTSVGNAVGAPKLQEITTVHIVDTLITGTGDTGPEFARALKRMDARVAVPATINVGNVDLEHPAINKPSEYTFEISKEIMNIYQDMGCSPTYTCSPFQEPQNQLRFGEHVVWGESSAVPYANSVFGARTNRYGQFITSAAAITGRIPLSGLHCDENRRGQIVINIDKLPKKWLDNNLFYHMLGYRVGQIVGEKIPVITGVNHDISKDDLKAFGAAAATSGGIAMFHMVGVTPEAPTLEKALHGKPAEEIHNIESTDITKVYDSFSLKDRGEQLDAVCLGAPHLSLEEVTKIYGLLKKINWDLKIPLYIAMSRRTLRILEERGWAAHFKNAGVTIVVDRCVYFPGILWSDGLTIMTDSAKWAHYAPRCMSAKVTIGTFTDCILSAQKGMVVSENSLEDDAV